MKRKRLSQLRAISYSYSQRAKANRRAFIIEREGSLAEFEKSRYKSEYWYIRAKYGERIY